MVFDIVGAHGKKSAESDVKSKIFYDDAFFLQAINEIFGHIEAGGRRSGGAHIFGPDGLVAFLVAFGGVTMKIWRQGNSAVFFGELVKRSVGFDFSDTVTENLGD